MLDDGTYRLTLIALHVEPGWRQYSEIAGEHTTPTLVYEVIVKEDENESETVYESRIIEPETGEMVHNEPYRSPLMEPLYAWWSRETETAPPKGICSPGQAPASTINKTNDRKHSGKTR